MNATLSYRYDAVADCDRELLLNAGSRRVEVLPVRAASGRGPGLFVSRQYFVNTFFRVVIAILRLVYLYALVVFGTVNLARLAGVRHELDKYVSVGGNTYTQLWGMCCREQVTQEVTDSS